VTVSRAMIVGVCVVAVAAACGSKSPTAPTASASSKLVPTLLSPANGAAAETFRPTLSVRNVTSDQAGAKTYEFEISDAGDFSHMVARQASVAEGADGTTSYTPDFDLQTTTRMYWRVRVNQGQALRVAALHGLGIVLQPAILLETDVQAGRLVRLLPQHELPSRPMHVVYLPDRYRSPKLRSFVEFVVERFG